MDASGQVRPVKVLNLVERDFRHESSMTGSVGLYREERIGFEVAGRVLSVLDMGLEVIGPALDEAGVLVRPGDVVAAIVAFASRYVTLLPGDLIFTGTPGSTRPMQPGDVVAVELQGVGTVRNAVARR